LAKDKVNIRRLKNFAFENLTRDWVLREILLSEPDEMDGSEFCVKANVWLKLSRGKAYERK